MRANCYAILDRAVEEGVAYGWNRAHKHTSTPTEEQVKEAVRNAIMSEVCEVFEFEPYESNDTGA